MARGVAWRALWPVWVPAVVFCLLNVGAYVWLSGKSVGRQAGVRNEVQRLQKRVGHLRQVEEAAARDREAVAALNSALNDVYGKVFGSLSERLPAILKALGSATRDAGLSPDTFAYDAKKDEKLKLVQFGIRFAVSGRYRQIRKMLAALQASPQFFVIDRIRISGEAGTATDQLEVGVHLTTYLARADEELLRRLTGGIQGKDQRR